MYATNFVFFMSAVKQNGDHKQTLKMIVGECKYLKNEIDGR